MRLRRLRGISQQKLAQRMGTKQPAIARIEAGDANLRLKTLVDLARALDATVHIDLEPQEHLGARRYSKWWEYNEMLRGQTTNFVFHTTVNLNVQLPREYPEGLRILTEEPAYFVDFDVEKAVGAERLLTSG